MHLGRLCEPPEPVWTFRGNRKVLLRVGNRVFCVKRRNVDNLEAVFVRLQAKCQAARLKHDTLYVSAKFFHKYSFFFFFLEM